MSKVFKTQRRVEFRDTDAAGIVHFSVFFAYMEQAEHEMLRQLGLGVMLKIDGKHIGFPRVNAECNYRSPIKFEDNVDVAIVVQRMGRKSITYGFRFSCEDRHIADGSLTAACCELDSGKPVAVAIPQSFLTALEPYKVPVDDPSDNA